MSCSHPSSLMTLSYKQYTDWKFVQNFSCPNTRCCLLNIAKANTPQPGTVRCKVQCCVKVLSVARSAWYIVQAIKPLVRQIQSRVLANTRCEPFQRLGSWCRKYGLRPPLTGRRGKMRSTMASESSPACFSQWNTAVIAPAVIPCLPHDSLFCFHYS